MAKTTVVNPDTSIVYNARNADTALIEGDCMDFDAEEAGTNWGTLSNDFVLNNSNKRITYWIKTTHEAKIETERKMRSVLDKKILNMRVERLTQSLGLEFIKRIRYYIKSFHAQDENDFISGVSSMLNIKLSPAQRRMSSLPKPYIRGGSRNGSRLGSTMGISPERKIGNRVSFVNPLAPYKAPEEYHPDEGHDAI